MMNFQKQPTYHPRPRNNRGTRKPWDPMDAQRQQLWDLDAQQPWELAPLAIDNNTPPREEWRRWDDKWIRYADAMRLYDYPPDLQRDYFMYALGATGRAELATLNLSPDEELNLSFVRDRLAGHFERMLMLRRFYFNRVHQGYHLTFEEFLDKLMTHSNGCEYGDMREELVRDRLIAGLQCRDTQNQLLQELHLTLPRAIDICRSRENNQQHKRQQHSNRRAMRFSRMLNEARKEFSQYRNASAQALVKMKLNPPIEIKDDIDAPKNSVVIKKEVADGNCVEIKDKCEDRKEDESNKRHEVACTDIVVIKKESEKCNERELIPLLSIKSEPPEESIDECIQNLNQKLGYTST